jgi:hypothetical protein
MVHATFHRGEWHYAVSAEGQALRPEAPRYPLTLPGREPPAGGMVRATRITVAVDELRSGWVEHVRNRPGLVEVPATPGFTAVAVELLFLSPVVGPVSDASFIVGRIARGGGAGAALIVAHAMNLAQPVRERFSSEIPQALAGMRAAGWDGSPTRFVITGHDPVEGYLSQVEVASDA